MVNPPLAGGSSLLRIGEFGELCGLSVKTLRHYDQMGVLTPEITDPSSGYRYYNPRQLRDAHRISALRDLGVPLREIKRIASSGDEGSAVDDELRRRGRALRAELRRVAALIGDLDDRPAGISALDAVVRTYEAPGGTFAVLRGEVTVAHTAEAGFDRLELEVATEGTRDQRPPMLAVYGEHSTGLDVEFAVPVCRPSRLSTRVIPRRLVASTVVTGSYEAVPVAAAAMMRWVARRDLRPVGPVEEVYLRFAAAGTHAIAGDVLVSDPHSFVTEVRVEVA